MAGMEQQLAAATNIIEKQLDAEIERLDNLGQDDLEQIRKDRIKAMQQAQKDKQDWLVNGHGSYSELKDEPEFFSTTKKSKRVVCHFFKDDSMRCKIVDKHLNIIAEKHIETKFVKVNVEKVKWLCERLRITVIPTILCIIEQKTKDMIVGFQDLGNHDEFSTAMMEWRLGCATVIDYKGDLLNPPDEAGASNKKKSIFGAGGGSKKSGVRENDSDDDSDNDW